MNVTLIGCTPQPEKTVAAAAKLCYSKTGVTNLMEGLTDEKAAGFLEMLESMGHASPIEHANFTFGIEGVSRSFLAQITRHRIGSYSVQSQRYVVKSGFETIMPPAIRDIPQAAEEFEAAMDSCGKHYDRLTEILREHHTQRLINEGKDPEEAARLAVKIAIEDARYVLPNACDTKMVVTMNARSLHNFFEKRCCNRAQWEIHQVADEMLKLVYHEAPSLFAHAGPACLNGPCPEGKMSCGKAAQVREYYRQLKERAKNG